MNAHDPMHRLRAARPADGPSADDDDLFARIVAEPGDSRLRTSSGRRSRWALVQRPRLLAGGSLAAAGVAAAVTLMFSGGAASPAFAVTREPDGTVLVNLSSPDGIVGADKQLVAMGINEQVDYRLAAGAATNSAPVACKLVLGPGDLTAAPASAGPQVKMLLARDNTAMISATEANTGQPTGLVHLSGCISYPEGPGTELGNSGQAFLNANGG